MDQRLTKPELELKAVSVRYGDVLAVADTTLDIARGEFIAVVGPSGCGKSSLLKLASGLLPPSGGEISLAGAPITGPLKGVGMAFQNATLLPWRTTLENVMLPLEIVEPFKSSRDRRPLIDRARRMLATVGLDEFADKYPWQLSGGMQQRASLCRAIVHEPRLVMLDEPFAALDAFTREELWSVMQDLWLKQRFTAILVTHELREAAFLADSIAIMSSRPGRVLHRYPVDLPRPRSIETTFEPAFVDLVHELRQRIAELRRT